MRTDTQGELGTAKSPKLAERIARDLGAQLRSGRYKSGAPLGTEAELLSRFGSSRSTIREAIAILEREGVVDVRRGRGGGLFVAPPDAGTLSDSMSALFEFLGVTAKEIMAVRRILNALALRLTQEQMTREDVAQLRSPGLKHAAILRATHNPPLQILARSARRFEILALLRSQVSAEEYFEFLKGVIRLQDEQAEALLGGDLGTALAIDDESLACAEIFMAHILAEQCEHTPEELVGRLELFVGRQRPLKKPEKITYALMSDILDRGWPVGVHLGSEQEMLERYSVGRSVFREALRPMEQVGVLEMRTGRQSGLKIAAPAVENVRADSLRRFEQLQAPRSAFTRIFDALGSACVQMAAGQRLPTAGSPTLSAQADLDQVLAHAGGNRVLSLMLDIMKAFAEPWSAGPQAFTTVLSAVDSNDPALAYRSFHLLRSS